MNKTKEEKLVELKQKLADYEEKLKREMIGYRGVIHESAASEIKHTKVMIFRAMIDSLNKEISDLKKSI